VILGYFIAFIKRMKVVQFPRIALSLRAFMVKKCRLPGNQDSTRLLMNCLIA
jgi:hypothetical protein